MEQILLPYGLPKETVAAIMMLYKNMKVKVRSPDGNIWLIRRINSNLKKKKMMEQILIFSEHQFLVKYRIVKVQQLSYQTKFSFGFSCFLN